MIKLTTDATISESKGQTPEKKAASTIPKTHDVTNVPEKIKIWVRISFTLPAWIS